MLPMWQVGMGLNHFRVFFNLFRQLRRMPMWPRLLLWLAHRKNKLNMVRADRYLFRFIAKFRRTFISNP